MIPPQMYRYTVCICLFLVLTCVNGAAVAFEPGNGPDEPLIGILTIPVWEDGIIYFAGWPDAFYAFDEEKNEARWAVALDPQPDELAFQYLPAPPPAPVLSYVLVQMGRRIWGVSKVDGRSVWSIDRLPPASGDEASRTSNPLPGYYIFGEDTDPAVITLEEDETRWYCRGRRLGDGGLDWERPLNGEPGGWWLERDSLWIVTEISGPNGPASTVDRPCALARYDASTGDLIWSAPVDNDSAFRACLRTDGRIFLLEQNDGVFGFRSIHEESGEIQRIINYEAGDFIDALASDDKLIVMHRDSVPGSQIVKFSLYYTSLNPIRFQTIREARYDQLFHVPGIDRNLFFYGGTAYELYNGNLVWSEDAQREVVDWAADDERIYFWDSVGSIVALERLTSQEIWRIPFPNLPPIHLMGPDFSGAALTLIENRLFATTPLGELYRLNTETGEQFPGIIKVPDSAQSAFNADNGTTSGAGRSNKSGLIIWLVVFLALVGAGTWYVRRRGRQKGGIDGI